MVDGAEEMDEEEFGASCLAFLRGVLLPVSLSESESSSETEIARATRFRLFVGVASGAGVLALVWAGTAGLLFMRICSYYGRDTVSR